MFRYVLNRVMTSVLLIAVISLLAYTLLYSTAGDVGRRLLGMNASEAAVVAKNAELGLDRPLWESYIAWLGNAVTGDLGRSWFSGQAVFAAISSRVGVTLTLVITATVLGGVIAVVIGVWSSRRRGWPDRLVQILAVVGFAVPSFLIALGLVLVFAVQYNWFAATGYVAPSRSIQGWLATATLPIIALTIGTVAGVAQQVRGSMIDVMRRDFVRTLRSRGMPEREVVYLHALRNSAGPALSVLAVQFIGLLGGSVIVEQVFAIPGLGQVAVASTVQGDIPLVMGLVLVTAVIVVVVNLAIDLLQGWLNPKVRVS